HRVTRGSHRFRARDPGATRGWMVGDAGGCAGVGAHHAAVPGERLAHRARASRTARGRRIRGGSGAALAGRDAGVSRQRRGRSSHPPAAGAQKPAPVGAPPTPLAHPAMLFALLIAAGGVLASVTFRLFETDFWQHLTVGKAIWTLHRVPTTQLWSWASYGDPEMNSAWLFRALIWKFWSAGGVWGLFEWRWATTLGAFALLWAAARRMGARGFAALII